ncbi:ribonuclease T2 family protein [Candidatus Electronema sp. PJ]|uniref:ribonuclease T2 family protein n=1 Tax=Candidatus Electronema sp. PJ TaxID=3401572 RepID=UPI003AA999FB
MKKVFLAVAAFSCCAGSAFAENVEGTFTAVSECDAYQSFNKGTNPGKVKVKPGVTYEAEEINKAGDWNWIRVDMEGAVPNLRWVSKECGTANIKSEVKDDSVTDTTANGGSKKKKCSTPNQHDSYVMAMTWQPGFCEHPPHNDKPECSALEQGKLSVAHLTLHGLWPNKKECGTRYGNCGSAPLELEEDTLTMLAPWMPNCYFADPVCKFAEYEWKKHGTCQERDDDAYFKLAVDILQRVDTSEIGKYLKDNIGEMISVDAYRKHIEQTMGKDVADRMLLVCPKGQKGYLQEIRLQLPKDIVVADDISKMLAGANTFGGNFSSGCNNEIHIERSGRD